ncbi:MAG TPA: 4-(cytidine 5'-diphospho)-2-C-methyl-D-erythritol kinase [Blastocatellia bacterium]
MKTTVRSYAKINWTLDVLHRRPDGFHEIRTLYQTVSLHDRLHITPTPGAIEIVCSDPRVPSDESNLVFKAASSLREAIGIRAGARFEIEKRVPVAGGLGGGSSNAAAALMALPRVWGTDLGLEQLIKLAASIGSDVPFFLFGGTAVGVGRGEEVYITEDVECGNILLANPGVAVSTATAYRALGRLTMGTPGSIIPVTLLAANAGMPPPTKGGNDLEVAVIPIHSEIGNLKQRLIDFGASHALMSGSGGTVFGVFDNLPTSERARDQLRSEGLWCELVSAVGRKAYQAGLFEKT